MKLLLINFQRTGDIIQTFHIIHSLKRTKPNYKIFYATNSIHSNSLQLIDDYLDGKFIIDYFKIFDNINSNIYKAFSYLKSIVLNINKEKFHTITNLNFSLLSAIFTNLLTAKNKIGAELLNSTTIKIDNKYFREIYLNIENVNFKYNIVEFYLKGLELPYFPPTSICNYEFETKKNFQIIIHPGASRNEKKWGKKNYIKLIKLLNEHYNGKVEFILTGVAKEFHENQLICEQLKRIGINLKNLSGKLNLKELKKVIDSSNIVISGDTAIQHIAALTKVKAISIFLGNAYHYHTYPYSLNKTVIFPRIDCYPCNANYTCTHQRCKYSITPEIVMDAVVSKKKSYTNILSTYLSQDGYLKLIS